MWHFTARAVEPVTAIFFYGTILRESCERDHSLGYELFKRMGAVMIKRLQAAREKMVAVDADETELQPVVLQSPFMDQELDIAPPCGRTKCADSPGCTRAHMTKAR
jgi:CRP-like cAMP-binding protein